MRHEMQMERLLIKDRVIVSLLFVTVIWTVKVAEVLFGLNLSQYGVLPRHLDGLWGLLLMPLLHADFGHVGANSVPSFVLILATLQFYPKVAGRVIVGTSVTSAGLVWVFARPAMHIGASGLIYALAAFLFFSGIFRRETKAIAVAMLVAMLYGSMVWGVLPIYPDVSWEGHLFGGVAGGLFAYRYRWTDRAIETDEEWDDQEATSPYNTH